jgi:hypothetical protein
MGTSENFVIISLFSENKRAGRGLYWASRHPLRRRGGRGRTRATTADCGRCRLPKENKRDREHSTSLSLVAMTSER